MNPAVEARIEPLGKGARIWVAGDGEPLLVLHGWGLDPGVHETGLTLLAARGFRVAVPSLAVVGRRWDVDRAVHRARKALDHLGWNRAIVVGNSLGGAVATTLAANSPERVRILALVNSVGVRLDRPIWGWALPLRRYATAGNLRALRAFSRNALRGRGALNLAQAALWAKRAGLEDELARVREHRIPSVVVWSEGDRLLPIDAGRDAARILGAPLRIVPGVDHDWTIRRPKLFADELEIALRAKLGDLPARPEGLGALLRSVPRVPLRTLRSPLRRPSTP